MYGIMYGNVWNIYNYIYHKNQRNVGEDTIHGSYWLYEAPIFQRCLFDKVQRTMGHRLFMLPAEGGFEAKRSLVR